MGGTIADLIFESIGPRTLMSVGADSFVATDKSISFEVGAGLRKRKVTIEFDEDRDLCNIRRRRSIGGSWRREETTEGLSLDDLAAWLIERSRGHL